jgi:hypothetical protein
VSGTKRKKKQRPPAARPQPVRVAGAERPRPTAPVTRQPWRVTPATGVGAAIVLLALLVVGIGASALVAGALLLRHASPRVLPSAAPTAWCAAVLLQIGLLLVALVALPLIGVDVLTRGAAFPVLLLPALAGAVVLVAVPAREDAEREPLPWFDGVLAGITAGVLLTAWWVESRSPGTGLAWAMSGDARNHVLNMRQVIEQGGATLASLQSYPLTANAIGGTLAVAAGRGGLPPGTLLLHDVEALASLYVLIALAVSVLFAAVTAMVVTLRSRPASSPLLAPVLVVAALLPTTALVSMTGLRDGFLTAYLGLAVLLAAVGLALAGAARPSAMLALLVAASGPLLLTVWSVLALLVVPVTFLLAWFALRTPTAGAGPDRWRRPLLGLALLLGLVPLVLFYAQMETLSAAFALSGAVIRPDCALLVLLVLAAAAAVAVAQEPPVRRAALSALTVLTTGGLVIAWLESFQPESADWGYYGSKTLWILGSAYLWLLLVPAVLVAVDVAARRDASDFACGVGAVALAVLAPVLADVTSPLKNPLRFAAAGWEQPAAVNVPSLQELGDAGDPFAYWRWAVPTAYTGDDRIGNFWAAAIWGTTRAGVPVDVDGLPGGPRAWAYSAGGDIQALCALASAVPGLRVVTTDPTVEGLLGNACPQASAVVVLDT